MWGNYYVIIGDMLKSPLNGDLALLELSQVLALPTIAPIWAIKAIPHTPTTQIARLPNCTIDSIRVNNWVNKRGNTRICGLIFAAIYVIINM